VSGEGKALDPAGIPLTSGEALRDRPAWHRTGTDSWSSGRNAGRKDWDVYGAVVTAAGDKPQATLLLAGDTHNQCRPDVAYAKNSYHVVYMAYEGKTYGICGKRLSPDGKPVGDQRLALHP